ncbi:hypothetical protein V8E54_005279 [Elaphomyces granulatus]|jgi:hypothetical protein
MDAATRGDKALANSNWPVAIEHYTRALVEVPRAPSYYVKRSTAYSRRRPADGGPDCSAALHDAETALILARERGKRELILDAQMRRAVTLYQLGRYGDAGYIFDIMKKKIDASSTTKDRSDELQAAMSQSSSGSAAKNSHQQELAIWLMKIKGKLGSLEEGSEKAVVAVKEFPDIKIPSDKELKKILLLQLSALTASGIIENEEVFGKDDVASQPPVKTAEPKIDPASSATLTSGPAAPVSNVIRHEWYQSSDSVVLTLYAKGVQKDTVDVNLHETSISIQFPLSSGSDFAFTLDPLFAAIDPALSKVSIMSTKIEMVLHKKISGQRWSALESTSKFPTDRTSISGTTPPVPTMAAASNPASSQDSGPAYPTSSRHGVKNWDKLAVELTSKKQSKAADSKGKSKEVDGEDEGEKSDGGDSVDSDYGTGDPVDAFFKKLYANADPDTRRAMVKSYYESQGTALSTNWDEVGKGKVETRPPSD